MTLPDSWPPVGPKKIEVHIIFTVPAADVTEYENALELGLSIEETIAEQFRPEFAPVEVKCLNIYDADPNEEPEAETRLRELLADFLPVRDVARKNRRDKEAGARMVELAARMEQLKEPIGFERWRAIFNEEYGTHRARP